MVMTTYYIPNTPAVCRLVTPCVYRNKSSVCDQPSINKGNSDAACHRMRNKQILSLLTTELPPWLSGEPYYCKLCGAGGGEYMACEMPDCELESKEEAMTRLRPGDQS